VNKKAISPALIMPAVIALVIVVSLIAFLASPNIRFTLIGIALIGVTLIFIAPSAVSGDFTREKLIFLMFMIFIGVGIMFVPKLGLFQQTAFDNPTLCSGQVLNIDPDISLQFNGQLGKQVIRAVYSTLPSGECLTLKLRADQIDSSIDGFQANGDILLNVKLVDQGTSYTINQDNSQLFKKVRFENTGFELLCTASDCNSANYIASGYTGVDESGDCFCFYEDDKGRGGDFQPGFKYEWTADIQVGNLEKLTLFDRSQGNKLSGRMGDIAFAKWGGSLVGGSGFSGMQSLKDAYKPFSNNQWRIIDNGIYPITLNPQYTSVRSALDGCELSGLCGDEFLQVTAYNALFDQETVDQVLTFPQEQDIILAGGAQIISNTLTLIFQSPVVYPQFTIDIDAEEVGIFVSVGEPEVQCPANFDIKSGETKTADFVLKNINLDFSGSFTYRFECGGGSQSFVPTPPQTVVAGSSLNIKGTFGRTVENNGTITTDCKFIAEETNCLNNPFCDSSGLQTSDFCEFSYNSTFESGCTEGETRCEGGNLEKWTCQNDQSWIKEGCVYGCIVENENAICRTKEQAETSGSGNISGKLDCIPFLETEITTTTKDCGLLSWRKVLGSCKEVTTQRCGVGSAFVLTLFGVIGLAFLIALFAIPKKKKKKRKK